MARISTYIKDDGLTDKDLLIGSNYVSGENGAEEYETANFTLEGLSNFFAQDIIGSNDGLSYITENVELDGSTAKKVKICSFPTGTTIIDGSFRSSELTTVNLPDSLVTIQDNAFNNNFISSITIPNTVTSIGANAFNSNLLSSINIPNSVTSLGTQCFGYNHLTSITLGSGISVIPERCFYKNNAEITSLTIPTTAIDIGKQAFSPHISTSTMVDLASLSIPNGSAVRYEAFKRAEIDNLTIGDSCTIEIKSFDSAQISNLTIGDNAVLGAGYAGNSYQNAFVGATIGDLTIGDNASIVVGNTEFPSNCDINTAGPFTEVNFTGNVAIGDNVDFGNNWWFFESSGNLSSPAAITYGPNFTNGAFAFYAANSTQSITLRPNSANTIPDGFTVPVGFMAGTAITSLTIGDNVTVLGQAFDWNRFIETLTIGENVDFSQSTTLTQTCYGNPTTYTYSGQQFGQLAENVTGGISITIPGTTILGVSTFQAANISSLTIESGVTEIPERCFRGNTITSLSIPSTALTFGDRCFQNQTLPGITTLTLGSSGNPITVGDYAFESLPSTITVSIPTGSTLGINAFGTSATVNYY